MRERVKRESTQGSEASLPRAPRPDLCRRFARKELAGGLPAILHCFIGEAKKGSIPHAKALMSMAGLDKEGAIAPPRPRRSRRARSFSELLLTELRRGPAEPDAGESAT